MDQRTTEQSTRAIEVVTGFDPADDDLAGKSRELTLGLLKFSAAPFSRNQFTPGHVTCTALVLHPCEPLVLFMQHHRLKRWLLPGGHVEAEDESLSASAAREAVEETAVRLDAGSGLLVGMDVHGIPAKREEPYHLHHDLIWCFRASQVEIETSDEAPEVLWAGKSEWDRLGLAESIRRSIIRASLTA